MRRLIVVLALLIACASAAAQECGVRSTGLACPTATIAGAITSADCTASDLSGYDLWRFTGTAGDTITIDMKSTAFDTYLMLFDPSDVPVAENDDAASGSTDSRITFTLTASGSWTVVANALAANKSGDYTLSIACPLGTTPIRRRAARH
jgi:hypothetical protein